MERSKRLFCPKINRITMRERREKINRREKAFIAIAAVSILIAALSVFDSRGADVLPDIEKAGIQELSTEGFVAVKPMADVVDGQGAVSLTGSCYRMVAGTDVSQAESIRDGMNKMTNERPNTHELMRDIFKALDIEVVMVKVTDIKGDNFHGRLILQQGDTVLSMDSKPSDGIAIAIRTNSTIYFNETLLKQSGQKIC